MSQPSERFLFLERGWVMKSDLFIEEKEDEICTNCIYFQQQDDWCENHNFDTEPYDYCPSFDDDWEYIKRQEQFGKERD